MQDPQQARSGKSKKCCDEDLVGSRVIDVEVGVEHAMRVLQEIPALIPWSEEEQTGGGGVAAGADVARGERGRLVLLYFGGKWCRPCVNFSPKLAKFYEENKDSVCLVFVSTDRGPRDFDIFRKEKPYLSVPFENVAARRKLAKSLNVSMFPSVIVIDSMQGTETSRYQHGKVSHRRRGNRGDGRGVDRGQEWPDVGLLCLAENASGLFRGGADPAVAYGRFLESVHCF